MNNELPWIVGCEESQAVTIALREIGIEAYSCDKKPCSGGHPEWHFQGDIFEVVKAKKFGGAILHPPCTYLTVTANKWLKNQPERKSGALVGEARREAVEFFMRLAHLDIERIAIENPVGCMSSLWRKPDQIIQPFQFGHPEPKKTCLWLKNLPLLRPTKIVAPDYHTTKSGKRLPKWYAYADKSNGQESRAEIRSKTFPGIAKSMAEQWGNYQLKQDLFS